MVRWLLIFTKVSSERVAEFNLVRRGDKVYCPRLIRPALLRGRRVDRVVPLFPRYLFLQCVEGQSLSPVRSTTGVASIVCCGSTYSLVSDGIVEGLMRRADPVSGLHRLSAKRYPKGARVKVIAGAFEGLEGIFEREAAEERVVILLTLLGKETPVRISEQFVTARSA